MPPLVYDQTRVYDPHTYFTVEQTPDGCVIYPKMHDCSDAVARSVVRFLLHIIKHGIPRVGGLPLRLSLPTVPTNQNELVSSLPFLKVCAVAWDLGVIKDGIAKGFALSLSDCKKAHIASKYGDHPSRWNEDFWSIDVSGWDCEQYSYYFSTKINPRSKHIDDVVLGVASRIKRRSAAAFMEIDPPPVLAVSSTPDRDSKLLMDELKVAQQLSFLDDPVQVWSVYIVINKDGVQFALI